MRRRRRRDVAGAAWGMSEGADGRDRRDVVGAAWGMSAKGPVEMSRGWQRRGYNASYGNDS